jgi:two-component system, LuxR family, response regulator FixJ
VVDPKHSVVAVVDDDGAVRDSLQFLLEVMGHTVAAFASAADFLKSDLQRVACLILDHHMPGMTGLELVERLRATGVVLPVLLITGAPSAAITARATSLSVDRVLEKPPTDTDLLDFVTKAMS